MSTTAAPATPSGPAHVATVSFLASRTAPTGGFWVALAGGVALARVALRQGPRQGFGASLAAMLETVAIMGPARLSIPFTQAVTAPMLGRLEARGWRPLGQILVCGTVRMLCNAAGTAFFIWVVTGGLDAYAGAFDTVAERVGAHPGELGALALTAAGLLGWAAFASTVQVHVYRRGLAQWPSEQLAEGTGKPEEPDDRPLPTRPLPTRFDPRAVTVAAAVAFTVLLTTTAWPVLAVAAVWLAVMWALAGDDRAPVPTGIVLAAILGLSAIVFGLLGGIGADLALRRGARAALLVLVATWLRAAAGAHGLREVSRRALGRLRRVPAMEEAARVLDQIGTEGRLVAAGRSLRDALRAVPRRPMPVLDAVLGWVAGEAARFRASREGPPAPMALRLRLGDAAVAVLAAAPSLPLFLA